MDKLNKDKKPNASAGSKKIPGKQNDGFGKLK